MKCDDIKKMQGMYLDGMLDAAERSHAEQHLAGCPACRARIDTAVSMAALLRKLPEKPMPQAVHDNIMRAVRQQQCVAAQSGWVALLERFMMPAVSFAMVVAAVVYVADNRHALMAPSFVAMPAAMSTAPGTHRELSSLLADMAAIENAVRLSAGHRATGSSGVFRGTSDDTATSPVHVAFDTIQLQSLKRTPELQAIMQRRANRWPELEPFVRQGALGEDNRGMLQVRKPEMFTAADRNRVAAENHDRSLLCVLTGATSDSAALLARACRQAAPRGTAIQDADGRWQTRE